MAPFHICLWPFTCIFKIFWQDQSRPCWSSKAKNQSSQCGHKMSKTVATHLGGISVRRGRVRLDGETGHQVHDQLSQSSPSNVHLAGAGSWLRAQKRRHRFLGTACTGPTTIPLSDYCPALPSTSTKGHMDCTYAVSSQDLWQVKSFWAFLKMAIKSIFFLKNFKLKNGYLGAS